MEETFDLNISTAEHLGIGLFKYSFLPPEKFIIVNNALVEMLRFSSKMELKNETFWELFVYPYEAEAFYRQIAVEKKVKFFQAVFKDRNERPFWVAVTASSVCLDKKKEFVEGIVENICAYKEIEEKLALERDIAQSLLDNIPDAIYFKDKNNRIIKVNNFYARGMGLKPDDILGKTDFDFFPREQAQKMIDDDNYVLASGLPIVGKIERTLLPNGTWNQVITTKIPMFDRNGGVSGTMGVTRDMTAYANSEQERLKMVISALAALGKTLQMRDPYTYSHNHRVAAISERVGRQLGWDENRLLGMRLAGELHDLGKITIPLDILNKPGKLSEAEYNLIQGHVKVSYDIIKDVHFPFSLAETIYQHHERLNGSGYPRGLKADEISLEARILAVSDVLESMTSYRPYRESLGVGKAMEELEGGCREKYDPAIVYVVKSLLHSNGGKPFWLDN